MNHNRFFITIISTAIVSSALLLSACVKKVDESSLLIVEKQRAEVVFKDSTRSTYQPQFYVDVPINGPQALVDSVISFLNEQLYQSCEKMIGLYGEEKPILDYNSVRTNVGNNIVQHYVDKYKDYFEKELMNFFTVSLLVIAQTETYVTYGVEFYHCGGSCGSELLCYTFDKKDGHRLGEIISKDNLMRLINEDPIYKKEKDLFGPTIDDNTVYDIREVALLQDHLLYVNNGEANHYSVMRFSYEDVISYLSDEAKKLVKVQGEDESGQICWDDWYMGYQIGTVRTDDNDMIYLMERCPQMLSDYDFSPSSEIGASDGVLLKVCKKKGRNYVPVDILVKDGQKSPAISFILPDFAWTNPNLDNGYFAYDEMKKELYAPYWADSLTAKMDVYQFNGRQFVFSGKSVDSYKRSK